MPLKLAARADVAPRDKPKPIDKSGLTENDWRLIRVDLAFRDAHYATEDADACRRKLARLDALLNDPSLLSEYGNDHPDRTAAMIRHAELSQERQRHEREARRAAKETAVSWALLKHEDARWFVEGLVLTWSDSPVFGLALADRVLNQSPFWTTVIRRWQQPRQETYERCPF